MPAAAGGTSASEKYEPNAVLYHADSSRISIIGESFCVFRLAYCSGHEDSHDMFCAYVIIVIKTSYIYVDVTLNKRCLGPT